MLDHIIFAYEFDGKGEGLPLEGDEISQLIKSDKLAWVHLDADNSNTKKWLDKEIEYLDPLIIKALTEDETRPRMLQVGDGALMILRGVNLNNDSDPEDMVSIRIWIDKHRIVSVRKRKLRAILDIESRLQKGKGPKDSAEFIIMLINRLFERMEPTLNSLDDAMDELEEMVIESPDVSIRERISTVRKKAILIRRHMAPQREAIDQLRMADLKWLKEKHTRHLLESYNHVSRYVEDLDALRERSQIVKDELMGVLTDKMNKNMYILSVIAAIFLPLGFLTGLLGINVGGIPGSDNKDAFYIFCGMLIFIVAVQIIVFKRCKWF
jgi:zinc transporter